MEETRCYTLYAKEAAGGSVPATIAGTSLSGNSLQWLFYIPRLVNL